MDLSNLTADYNNGHSNTHKPLYLWTKKRYATEQTYSTKVDAMRYKKKKLCNDRSSTHPPDHTLTPHLHLVHRKMMEANPTHNKQMPDPMTPTSQIIQPMIALMFRAHDGAFGELGDVEDEAEDVGEDGGHDGCDERRERRG